MPPIQNGLICQQCGSVGMTSFQRALLAKRFCVCTNHLLPFPQPGGLPGQVHIKSTKSTSNPPGGLPDQVSPPWRAFQLQTLRSHTQGFIFKWRGCHLSQGAIEHYRHDIFKLFTLADFWPKHFYPKVRKSTFLGSAPFVQQTLPKTFWNDNMGDIHLLGPICM